MKKNLFILLFFTSLIAFSQKVVNYKGKVQLDSKKNITATFIVSMEANNSMEDLEFLINKNADVSKILCDNKHVDFEEEKVVDEFLSDVKKIRIKNVFSEKFSISISYKYPLTKIEDPNFIYNENWIELNFYTGFFPFRNSDRSYSYHIDIQVPKNYQVISSGTISKKRNIYSISSLGNTFDIPLTISDKFEIFNSSNGKIRFYTVGLNEKTKDELKKDAEDIFNLYEEKFGKTVSNELIVCVNPYNHQMSFARKGLVSLALGKDYTSRNRQTLAHEIGHLWWSNAQFDTWEEWLNESFAEYSSLLWCERNFDKKEFEEILKSYTEELKNSVKISQLKGSMDNNWYSIIYIKGSYLLFDMYKTIGEEKFFAMLQEVNIKKINNTKDLKEIFSKYLSKEQMEHFFKNI